jgi:hypothetical protein
MDSDFRQATRTDGKSFLGFFVGDNSRWQQNQVGYSNLKMDFGETIRVKTRVGGSTYEASDAFFNSLGDNKNSAEQRAARFANLGSVSGTAALTRVEEDVLRFGSSKVTLFQEFARVDPFFEDIKFSDKALSKQTKEDVFSKPDRETGRYGVSFLQGSSGVTFSQSMISNITDSPTSFYKEQRFDSKAWLGLRDLSNSADSFVGNLVPSSVWVGYGEGDVRRNGASMSAATINGLSMPAATINGSSMPAATSIIDMNAGAAWKWADIDTTLGVWRSLESGPQQMSNLSTRSFSEGADVSVGIQKKKWNINGYVSFTRSSYEDGWNNYSNYNVNGGVSFTLLFEKWPNVTLALDVSTYGDAYVASDGTDAGRLRTAGIAFDFSKYVVERSVQKLQLFYYVRDEGFDSRWGTIQTQNLTLAHVFGGVMRGRW